ncbi:bifunctional 2-polyprenyl-6-hydroxyphenol methylase/3-demethylubiquinol 3-O-methyltransferase UbiG [Nostoc sp. FACHB-280]|uniref:class I SAM-dependent methyltransferase n=1 Tax=Nostoc sp. FACHB-280 TaxID=2692839 RepID=UPI00168BCB0C|nr:class I SAM-dependent methyltransferase [Nostoc sp. FACHB-280]MBD2495964.1 class I SAM-dependent methyltransferase [Nostoc sp. FACHB-280]
MEDLKQKIASFSQKDLEVRKNWYSPAAEAYNKARPRYPKNFIEQVIQLSQLSPGSRILEVGCGPGTATISFAQLGYSMLCLEPNPDFCELAKQNCRSYSNVEIQNTSFEEWSLQPEQFDAVLAASSFHWIPPDIGYPKAASALKENGHLLLFWNKELQPSYEVYLSLSAVYQKYAPSLDRYEDWEAQQKVFQEFGNILIDSGKFQDIQFGQVESEVVYSTDEYLTLLNTYSPYIKLEPEIKKALFAELSQRIDHDFDGNLQLSFISAFHIGRKI